ncbi:MAG: hypothetical protein AMXMBFR48_02560 [Ignavibacteriales bacterium]|jgi:sec-independent protein translocase protein TatA
MPNLGFTEILIIVGIIMLLFGAKKIPELAQGLGKGIKEFKKAVKEPADNDSDESKKEIKDK